MSNTLLLLLPWKNFFLLKHTRRAVIFLLPLLHCKVELCRCIISLVLDIYAPIGVWLGGSPSGNTNDGGKAGGEPGKKPEQDRNRVVEHGNLLFVYRMGEKTGCETVSRMEGLPPSGR
jgi:hypothetical protein